APLELVPLGLYYQAPDRFRSDVEVLVGPPLALPARRAEEADRAWELRIHQAIAEALDAGSVRCIDAAGFASAEAQAQAAAAQGESYALAFVDAQSKWQSGRIPPVPPPTCLGRAWPWDWLGVAAFMLLAAPVLLIGRAAGGKADARNTVS